MPDISGKLFPNALTIIVQLLSTGILLIAFKKFLWGPLLEYFKRRADYIEATINEANDMNETAKQNMELANQQAKDAAKQYRDILEEAKLDASKAKEAILQEAKEEAQYKVEQAKKETENEKLQAQAMMKEEIINVAIDVASKVMEKNMDIATNQELAQEFVKEVIN